MRTGIYILIVAAGLLGGCSTQPQMDYESAGFAEVSGTVTMDGTPIAGVLVMFETEDRRFSSGRTDGDGRYVLYHTARHAGVMPGKKIVRISTGMAATEEEEATPRIETIPARYNTQSELTADVQAGASQTFDFDLTSEGEVEQPELPTTEE